MSSPNVIGIVGLGFVGKAIFNGFKNERTNVVCADPLLGTNIDYVLSHDPCVVFVSVPTPSTSNSDIDTSIVESVIQELEEKRNGRNYLIVLKSTVIPTVITKLKNKTHHFVYNPEFLRENNADKDFLTPDLSVFGSDSIDDSNRLYAIYREFSNCSMCDIHFTSPEEAALIKYTINTYLATKVMYFNQLYQLASSLNLSYDAIKNAVSSDKRIGCSHMTVPGPDGRFGFGGACFSKDIPAFIYMSKNLNSELSILKEAWNKNCDVRNSYDTKDDRELEQKVTFQYIL